MKRVRCSLDLKQQPPSFLPKTSTTDQQTCSLIKNAEPQSLLLYQAAGRKENFTYAIFIHVTAAADSNYSIAGDVSDFLQDAIYASIECFKNVYILRDL